MKTFKQILFMCFLAVLSACSEDAFVPQPEETLTTGDDSVDLISMVVPDIEMDASTRSKLYEDGDGLKFTWQENDAIGVVPLKGWPLHFPIKAENAGRNTAVFDGGGWSLRTDMKYAAVFPIKKEALDKDIKSIEYDYTGQTRSNYSNYDFMATGAITPSEGKVTFNMKRLSVILKIQISMPAGSSVRYGTLVAPSDVFGVVGTFNLSGNEPVVNPKSYTKVIHTDAGKNLTSASAWTYETYMMIPVPKQSLSGIALKFRLTSDEGYAYEATLQGKEFEAGKAYILTGEANGATIRNKVLIGLAELNEGVTFVLDPYGFVNVNENLAAIQKVTNIYLSGGDPTALDEIEYFTNLKTLNCQNCNLKSLNVSRNTMLTTLDVSKNQLTSLDISKNVKLTELICNSNQLISLNASGCPDLTTLKCFSNSLSSLDVSRCTKLTSLDCQSNSLTSIDVTNNLCLTELIIDNNHLTSLDVSYNTSLKRLQCGHNNLSSLDISCNTELENISCYMNKLTSLDVSNNTELEYLDCFDNQLISLDISNNPDLKTLLCYTNQLTSLDVTKNTWLLSLSCYSNQLTSLDVSKCIHMTELYCHNNQLTTLNVTNNTQLQKLSCRSNHLSSLDVSKCNYITWPNLRCGLQTDKTTGNYIYNQVEGNDNMMEYFFEYSTIPECATGQSNYYVEYLDERYPS